MRIAVAGGTGTVGHHLVARAAQDGHDLVVLSRSRGVDAEQGDGLDEALRGVDVIVDVANPRSIEQDAATAFYTAVATNLQRAGAAQGVRHIVTLSIVGAEQTSFGYYLSKVAQEEAAAAGPVPSTIQRATQFHELPAQLLAGTRQGDTGSVLDLRPVQPVAARTVAEVLYEVALADPQGRAPDLGGPQEEALLDMGRKFVAYRGEPLTVEPIPVPEVPAGSILPGPGARLEGPSFEAWLVGEDAAAMKV
jgi:uncharacterized protein YbjT (DUF2867 family)